MIDIEKTYTSNNYGDFRIVKYVNCQHVGVEFIDTGYMTITQSAHIIRGMVKDPLAPMVYDVGYIGIGHHMAYIDKVKTKEYSLWSGMMERCYSSRFHTKYPSYIGCTVCDEWHDFQVFCDWLEVNYVDGCDLDKDIKIKGNRVYSPTACMFVTKKDNSIEASAKHYKFIDPEGVEVAIYNLSEFCKGSHLQQRSMATVHRGERKTHKGWRKA
jgi:hypothetical protein